VVTVAGRQVTAGRAWRHAQRLARRTGTAVTTEFRAAALGVVDRGWFGLTPLRVHVVACGFPRTGSSMLQVMISSCVDDVKTFPEEIDALTAARRELRNEPYLFTKRPTDVHRVEAIRAHYRDRRADVAFVLMLRDPRDVLTSVHQGRLGRGYYVSTERFRGLYDRWVALSSDPDVLVVRYEDLVNDTSRVEQALTDLTGWTVHTPFAQFEQAAVHAGPRGSTIEAAMGGLRPVDRSGLARWQAPEHEARVAQVSAEIPELREMIEQMGYAS
jgi:hypothetical protein